MADDPKTTDPVPSDSNAQPVSRSPGATVYVFSVRWLLAGLVSFLIVGAALGGWYFFQTRNTVERIVGVARHSFEEAKELLKDADEEKAKGASNDKVSEVKLKAVEKLRQAADILGDFRRQQPNEKNRDLLILHLDILESLQTVTGATVARRGDILSTCRLILGVVPENESLEYRRRILELEWENGNLPSVIVVAGDLLARTEKGGWDSYPAWRYLTLALMVQVSRGSGYQPQQVGVTLPSSIDKLLEKVHGMRPSDIEISALYADFVKDFRRKEYRDASSPEFQQRTVEDRDKMAQSIINDMVNRNKDDADKSKASLAYLVRYRFNSRFDLLGNENDKLDPDLEAVHRLNPGDPDGLILGGMRAMQQSFRAQKDGDSQLAEERKAVAKDFFRRTIDFNPENSVGYQHLGDFYMSEGKLKEAVKIWEECLVKNPSTDQEVIGRLVIGYIESNELDSAAGKIGLLDNVIRVYRISNPRLVPQVQSLAKLLSARLYATQGTRAIADGAMASGDPEKAKKLYKDAQDKYASALQILTQELSSFGASPGEYIVDPTIIHSRIIGESLMLAGLLASDRAEWDVATMYYEKAMGFAQYREQAAILASRAYLQRNSPSEAAKVLETAVHSNPDSVRLRSHFAESKFRQAMANSNPATRNLDAVKREFEFLANHKDQISQPWTVDFRLIQLEMIRESSTLDGTVSIKAIQTAVSKYRELEKNGKFPAKENEAAPKKYAEDLNFLSDLAGIYSSLAQLSEFDRILINIREFPDGESPDGTGEPVFFERRIAHALQRNDKEGAIAIINEAQDSDRLTDPQKQNFVVMAQNLSDDQSKSLDAMFERLKQADPESLKPQVFFLMGNMALDRNDIEYAKDLEARLETIEGEKGTMWRYIRVRRLMIEKDPPMDSIRQLLREIVDYRPGWDMAYTLKATTEEKQLLQSPNDKELQRRLVDSYRQSIRHGNIQQATWNRLLYLLEELELFDDVRTLQQEALVRGIRLHTAPGQFPRPYQQFYTQAYAAILKQEQQHADLAGRECLDLARGQREKPELINALNLGFGKLFLDNNMTDSARRHLAEIAKLGGSYVYPLAVCLAKGGQIDEGFSLILDEINRTPASLQVLLPSVLVLLAQVRPSEAVFQRIDAIVTRLEKGERHIIRGDVETAGPENIVDFGIKRIRTMTVRFPDSDVTPNPETLTILPPTTME